MKCVRFSHPLLVCFRMLVFFHHLLKQLSFLWLPWALPCWKLILCWLNFAYYPENKKVFFHVSHNPSWGTEWLSLAEGKPARPVAFWTAQKSTQFNPPHPVCRKSGKWRHIHTGFLPTVGKQWFSSKLYISSFNSWQLFSILSFIQQNYFSRFWKTVHIIESILMQRNGEKKDGK